MGRSMHEKVKMGIVLLIFGLLAVSIVFALQRLDVEEEGEEQDRITNMELIARTGGFCSAIFLISGFLMVFIYYNKTEKS